jgi:hypothetical protein
LRYSAVAQFPATRSNLRESQALHTLLVSSQVSDGSAASNQEHDEVPQLVLPMHDAPHHRSSQEQQQQQQQRRPLSAQAYYGSSGGGSDGRDLGPAADQSPGSSMQVRYLRHGLAHVV